MGTGAPVAPFAAIRRRGEPPPRAAAIDLGTNTALMTVLEADALDRRRLRVLEELHVVTGLGRDRGPDGGLNPVGRTRAMGALRHFATRLDALGVRPDSVVGAATAAVREARDGSAFLREVGQRVGIDLETVTGEQEAELVALAQERSFGDRLPLRVLDIGGGSTEVALRRKGRTEWKMSLPTGGVMLAAGGGWHPTPLGGGVAEALEALPADRERATLVGVAGTVTTGLQVARAVDPWDPALVHGQVMARTEVEGVIDRLAAMSPQERRDVPGLHPERAELIVAGLCLLTGVMERFEVDEVLVSDRGVRFGLLFERWPLTAVL